MYHRVKRFIDFVFSLFGIILLSPLFILLSILIWANMGYPFIFMQKRVGYKGKEFNLYKFRTMTSEKSPNGLLLPDDKRLTPLGKFLRSTSLDELPELLNILKGEMSIIGPRPLPPIYNEFYKDSEKARFKVKSGLIPPDSVDIDPVISWDKQLEYEANYANNISFLTDVKILIGVFNILVKRSKSQYGDYIRKALNDERKNMFNSETSK